MKADTPSLCCPGCGQPLIPAQERGRHDADGNYNQHRADCRCRWCEWIWFDDAPPVACACGTVAVVGIDDRHAYAMPDPDGVEAP